MELRTAKEKERDDLRNSQFTQMVKDANIRADSLLEKWVWREEQGCTAGQS